jgi:hypothetical protein
MHVPTEQRRMLRPLLIAAMAVGVAWFAWRGPVRALQEGGLYDFKLIYSGARAWLLGANPYDLESVVGAWIGAGGAADDPALDRPVSSLVYAPPTFVILAPFAALPWPAAGIAWTLFNVALFVLAVGAIAALAGLRGNSALGFWGAALWLAPFGTGFGLGQISLLVLAMGALGHVLRARGGGGSAFAGGALMGAGAVIKPQLGLLFVVYEAGRMRWRVLAGAGAAAAILVVLGAARLASSGVSWLGVWRRHIGEFPFADGDPTGTNPVAYLQYQFAYPLHTLTDDRLLVQVLVLGILGAVSLAYFFVDLKRGRERGESKAELVSLSMVSVVTLLITYHRIYDAVLLLFPLALGVAMLAGRGPWGRSGRGPGAALLLLLAPFVAPGTVLLKAVERRGILPDGLAGSILWETLIVPHATWALLGACVLLVVIRARTRAEGQSAP